MTTATYSGETRREHAVSGGAVLDEDASRSGTSDSGYRMSDGESVDSSLPSDVEGYTYEYINNGVADSATLGGMVSHDVYDTGYITWSTTNYTFPELDDGGTTANPAPTGSYSNANPESATLGSYVGATNPLTFDAVGWKQALDNKILLSPLHDVVFPPVPTSAPGISGAGINWWNAAKWLFPVNHVLGLGINWVANEVQNVADWVSSNGSVLGGMVLGMTADLGHMAAGIADLPGTVIDTMHNAELAGVRVANETGSDVDGVLAGVGYFAGSFVGVTQFAEGWYGEDFATGQQLSGTDAASRMFGGVSGMLMAGAGGLEMMDMDACLGGPKLFKDGCFTAGTLVLTGRGHEGIDGLGIGRRIARDEGSPQRAPVQLDTSKLCILRLEYIKPETHEVLTMAFLRPAEEGEKLSAGDTTPIILEETGVEGSARVIAVEPCPPIEEGEGELITGTFSQEHFDVRLLKLEGLDEPIEVTGSHPVYSEDQHTFVPVKDLAHVERLRTRTGAAIVESLHRKPGKWRVYNLEIGTVHRYYVSELDVLVHNSCSALRSSMENAGEVFEDGDQAAHIVPKGIASRDSITQASIDDARGILNKYDLLDDAANGFKTNVAGHLGTHTNGFLRILGDELKGADLEGGKTAVIQRLAKIKGRILAGEF